MFKIGEPSDLDGIQYKKIGHFYVTSRGFYKSREEAILSGDTPKWHVIKEMDDYLSATFLKIKGINNKSSHLTLKHIFKMILGRNVNSGDVVIALSKRYRVVHGKYGRRHFDISQVVVNKLRKIALHVANMDLRDEDYFD